jgi:hypothetical protein
LVGKLDECNALYYAYCVILVASPAKALIAGLPAPARRNQLLCQDAIEKKELAMDSQNSAKTYLIERKW